MQSLPLCTLELYRLQDDGGNDRSCVIARLSPTFRWTEIMEFFGASIVPPMTGYCATGALTLVTATSTRTVAAGQAFMVPMNSCIDLLTQGDDECVLLDLSDGLAQFITS